MELENFAERRSELFTSPLEIDVIVAGTLSADAQSTSFTTSSGEANFYDLGVTLDLDVSSGASCVSESGVFLLPEPPASLSLVCGIAALLALRRRAG